MRREKRRSDSRNTTENKGIHMRIAVTGAAGKLGRAAMARLQADGHDVVGLDRSSDASARITQVDLTDYGQTIDSLVGITARHDGVDAVVHLAAIPVNGLVPDVTTFHNNITVSFNVIHAAMRAGIHRIVFASSITAMGFPFDDAPPKVPVDETYVSANNTYGLGKVLEEAMANQLVGWNEQLSLTALRFTNVVDAGEYDSFDRAGDPTYRRDLLWSYVDARDGAQAISLALENGRPGFEIYNVVAADSGLSIPSRALVEDAFPGISIDDDLGEFDTLISIAKIRSALGYEPEHDWRSERS